MTEPTSLAGTGMVVAGISVAAILPGIDADALIGAFAGGTIYVISTPALKLWQRLAYLIVSAIAGYQATGEVQRLTPIHSTGLSAFIVSAVIIAIALAIIEKCKKGDFSWFRRGGSSQ